MKDIKSLNLLMTYPVYWSQYKVFRDFVQNFYDSKGANGWWKDFEYEFHQGVLMMKMKNNSFSYEWLLHIGASNKAKDKKVAGFFGEGFKIASLCAIRDYHWDITMSSQNWTLHVIQENLTVDGQERKGLAYEMSLGEMSKDTILKIGNVGSEQYELFKIVLLSFFYPQNPLLGDRIYEDEEVAIYERSSREIPLQLPITRDFGRRGVVFARYQMLGTLPFDLVVAYHSYEQRDREREKLYESDILKVLYKVAEKIDAATASCMLRCIQSKWNAYPEKLVDVHSWYYVVCQLIRTMTESEKVMGQFRKQYPNLLYAKRFYKEDVYSYNRRKIAKAWMHTQPQKYRVVMEQFKLLGYAELEELCEKSGGFAVNNQPTERERLYLGILEELAKVVFHRFFVEYGELTYRIIREDNAAYEGKAEVIKRRDKVHNNYGLQVKRQLQAISIKEKYLVKDTFSEALAVYLHELSHMFGGDSSENFSRALTIVSQLLVANIDVVKQYKNKWESLECGK